MAHIFISYSTRNSRYAYRLAAKLRDEGFDVWIDNAKLRSSVNWWEAIVRALRNASAFIVVMTPEAKESRWVQREVTLADNWGKPAFPVLLSGDNWEIYVLTQFEDVRTPGRGEDDAPLPPPEFYEALTQYVEPSNKGQDLTATAEVPQVTEDDDDDELLEAIREAPPPEEHPPETIPTPIADAATPGGSRVTGKLDSQPAGTAQQPASVQQQKRYIALGAVTAVVIIGVLLIGAVLLGSDAESPEDIVDTIGDDPQRVAEATLTDANESMNNMLNADATGTASVLTATAAHEDLADIDVQVDAPGVSGSVEIDLDEMQALVTDGDIPAAVATGEALIEAGAGNSDLFTLLGQALEADFEYDAAVEAYEQALEMDPDNVEAMLGLANHATATGDYETAVPLLRRAVDEAPNNAIVRSSLAWALFGAGEYEESLETFNLAIDELGAADAWAYANRAQVHYELNNLDRALNDLNRALELNDSDPNLYALRGDLHMAQGDDQRAASDYERAIDLNPDFAYFHIALGNVYWNLGRTDDAAEAFNDAADVAFDEFEEADAYYNLADLYFIEGEDPQLVLDALDQALEAVPDYEAALDLREDVLLEIGEDGGFDAALDDMDAPAAAPTVTPTARP